MFRIVALITLIVAILAVYKAGELNPIEVLRYEPDAYLLFKS